MDFPRQRPRNIKSGREMDAWNASKLAWFATHKPVREWPWSIIKEYQTKHHILASGARELQNWRVERHVRGEVTLISPASKRAYYSDELPAFTVFPYTPTYLLRADPSVSGLLRLDRNVVETQIVVHLYDDPRDVFSLMLTCKDMQGMCHNVLMRLARTRFGPLGTPKALMCAVEHEMEAKQKTKRRKTEGSNKLRDALMLEARDFRLDKWRYANVSDLIARSIEKYGCIDRLPAVRAQLQAQKDVRQEERRFVESNAPARLQQVNAFLRTVLGYATEVAVRFDEKKLVFVDGRVELVLSAFENGTNMRPQLWLGTVSGWIGMHSDSTMDAVCKSMLSMVPPALLNHALKYTQSTKPFHPLQHLVVQALMDVRHRNFFFYDRIMDESDWMQRLAYAFSEHFQKDTTAVIESGSYVCCWQHNRPEMRIYHLNHEAQATHTQYSVWMKLLSQRYTLRIATPSTGIDYAGAIPNYIVSQMRAVSFGHCLLSKKT